MMKTKERCPIPLRDWGVIRDPYIAPEAGGLQVVGIPTMGPKEGKRIATSDVVDVEGRVITTASGSVYRLEGPPSADYLDFLQNNGLAYDKDAPIGFGAGSRKAG